MSKEVDLQKLAPKDRQRAMRAAGLLPDEQHSKNCPRYHKASVDCVLPYSVCVPEDWKEIVERCDCVGDHTPSCHWPCDSKLQHADMSMDKLEVENANLRRALRIIRERTANMLKVRVEGMSFEDGVLEICKEVLDE